jgi:hypothetical protein
MVKELSDLTVEELSQLFISNIDNTKRKFCMTPEEAKILHNVIHKTERARYTFKMYGKESENADAFAKEHAGCVSRSAMSERFEYTFLPGGIGTCVTMKCIICGKEKNITDYDCW